VEGTQCRFGMEDDSRKVGCGEQLKMNSDSLGVVDDSKEAFCSLDTRDHPDAS